MYKHHLVLAAVAFLMCGIAAYFGVRIHNANENFLLTELNEFDKIHYDNVRLVPSLCMLAAIVTAPFLLTIIIFQLVAVKRAAIRQVKNIAIGLLVAVCIIILFDIATLLNPVFFDFSKWGFIWICLGMFIVVGNVLSLFIIKFSRKL